MPIKKILSFSGIALSAILFFNACNTNEPEEIEPVRFEIVNGFIIGPQGEKLLATDIGLVSFNKENKTFLLVESELKLAPLNDLAYSKADPLKQLLLASNSGVLNFTAQSLITSSNSGLQNNNVTRLGFDNNDRIFFATPDGISILDNLKWSASTGLNDLYLNYNITDIESAVNGFTYVTTNGGGVERFKTDVDGISGATLFDTDWTKLESNNINTVFIDSITQVYGTDMGVAIHTSEFTKWDWEIYTTTDGLIDNNVISVVKDKANNWWFGTAKGLSRFNNSVWTNYSVETNNILSDNIKFLAVDTDGSVWFASDEGLSVFSNNKWINYSK